MKRDPNAEAYGVLRCFVTELREFVKNQLARVHGNRWEKTAVPESVRERWKQRRQEACGNPWRAAPAESLLEFSDDGDLKDIILKGDNFEGVFERWFGPNPKLIETKLTEIKWFRDDVAHFRPVDRAQLAKLKSLCKDVSLCIARAAKVQADTDAPEELLSPDDVLSDKDPTELVASAQRRAASSGRGDMPAVTVAVEERLLDMIFEQGVSPSPDETDVAASAIHWRFNEWRRAPETEVLAWQVYAPREPVSKGSAVYLAIRYSPAALGARPAVKRRARPRFNPRPRPGRCIVRGPGSAWEEQFVMDVQGWAYVKYTPETLGEHDVFWAQASGGQPKTNPWVRDEFEVV